LLTNAGMLLLLLLLCSLLQANLQQSTDHY
jgi:hypothetical protein